MKNFKKFLTLMLCLCCVAGCSISALAKVTGSGALSHGGHAVFADSTSDGLNELSFTLTNTHDVETVDITVEKVWDDDEDRDGLRPETVDFTLYADGDVYDTQTLNADNGWTYTWEGLYKYEDEGKNIIYTLTEDDLEFYDVSITSEGSLENDNYIKYTFTNTHKLTSFDIKINKIWDDDDNRDGIRPDEIYIELYADDEYVDTYTMTAADGWTLTIEDLNVYEDHGQEIDYEIVEVDVDGYVGVFENVE